MRLGFEEIQTPFLSGSQSARKWTEDWAAAHLYCLACGADSVSPYENNRPVADLHCEDCSEEYELKSTKARFGRKVTDGAFATMCARLDAKTNPNLLLLRYDGEDHSVTDLSLVPKFFFTRELIERRKPLASTARRAGWIGCNILLNKVPAIGRIEIVRDRSVLPREAVLSSWSRTAFLHEKTPKARGWLIEVLNCVEALGTSEFTIDDAYGFTRQLQALYPGNRHVPEKIRQQLQVLRDQGILDFVSRGRYRLTPASR